MEPGKVGVGRDRRIHATDRLGVASEQRQVVHKDCQSFRVHRLRQIERARFDEIDRSSRVAVPALGRRLRERHARLTR